MNFKINVARKIAGGIALVGLGLLAFDLAPAAAAPPSWAPARGYRRDRDRDSYRYSRRNRDRYSGRYNDRYYNSGRYNRGRYYGGQYGIFGRPGDLDGDGIPNRRDRDRDGDGVPDRRDDHPANPRRR